MPEMEIRTQNDIREFIDIFLDKLNRDVCFNVKDKATNMIKKNGYKATRYDMQRYKMDLSWYQQQGSEYSGMTEMFHGQMITQIICGGCKHITHNYETFASLSVPVEKSHETLMDCLTAHLQEETLNANDGTPWRCDECKQNTLSTKTHKLWRVPKILMISLKRFTADLRKITKTISIPESLSLSNFTLSNGPNVYTLQCIACHVGSFQFGHYYAYCKHPNNKWYKLDDLDVQEVSCPDTSYGYMFFYVLVSSKKD